MSVFSRWSAAVVLLTALVDAALGQEEKVVARTFVPSPQQKVGEVRLIRRDGSNVVQTLLYTKVLRRVVGEIRKKEIGNWPEGAPGHAESVRYIDALEKAQADIWGKLPKFERGADPLQKLLIEFILDTNSSRVVLAEFEMRASGDDVEVGKRRTIATLDLQRSYVKKNMRLIAADSFAVAPERLAELVAPLAWLSEPTPGASVEPGDRPGVK